MKKHCLRIAAATLTLIAGIQTASAQLAVIDPANLLENTMSALKAVSGEIYQDTNVAYQYKMMANQLLQATKLGDAASAAQLNVITGDISRLSSYSSTMNQLYDGLTQNGQYVSKVQSLVSQSGKTPDQWYADQSTLLQNGDNNAKQLFQQGTDIQQHTQQLAQRRADIQAQLNLSPTEQATAQLTTHELDIVASQQQDMLQLMATSAQHEATSQTATNAQLEQLNAAKQAIATKQAIERQTFLGQSAN
jgi:hypothetical protein